MHPEVCELLTVFGKGEWSEMEWVCVEEGLGRACYYGNIVWSSAYKSNLNRLNVLQKRIICIIAKSRFDAHTSPLFQKYHLLTLDNIHLY